MGGGGGGGEQDGIDDSSVHKHAWLLGGSGGIPLGKILNLDPLRLLLTQSGTNFPNNILTTHTCTSSNIDGTTIITILYFKISGERGNSRASTPLYETVG